MDEERSRKRKQAVQGLRRVRGGVSTALTVTADIFVLVVQGVLLSGTADHPETTQSHASRPSPSKSSSRVPLAANSTTLPSQPLRPGATSFNWYPAPYCARHPLPVCLLPALSPWSYSPASWYKTVQRLPQSLVHPQKVFINR